MNKETKLKKNKKIILFYTIVTSWILFIEILRDLYNEIGQLYRGIDSLNK